MRCQKCGASNKWNDVFCRSCGARIELERVHSWSLLNSGEKLLYGASWVVWVLVAVLWTVGDSIHIPGGGLLQPAYTYYNTALVLLAISTPLLMVMTIVSARRKNKVIALHLAANAKQAPATPLNATDVPKETSTRPYGLDLVRMRADRELKAFKRSWWGCVVGVVVVPIMMAMLPITEVGFAIGNLDPNFASMLMLAYVLVLVVFVFFVRFPSDEKIKSRISMWRSDPVAVAPIYLTGRAAGPHNIVMPLLAGAFALWLSGLFAFFSLLFYLVFARMLSLFLYCYPIVLISLLGLVLQRRHATKAVASALGK
jgi:hypothetical protein